ncbi:MAG: hypothetical protein AAF471_04840, partial [Myxococcota bacterium]
MSQLFTIDFAIVAAYLLITLIVGIHFGRGITTMREYVIGGYRRYSVVILVATLLATRVGGGATFGSSEKIFVLGLIWFTVQLGVPIQEILVARYIAPHVGRFRNKLSVGEMMGDFYGRPGRVTIGIVGTIKCVGSIG